MAKRTTLFLSISLIALSLLSLCIGVYQLDLTTLLGDVRQLEVLFLSRLPRLLACILAGAGMSVAGIIMQQVCMNKFVSPTTGATLSSCQFGILLVMLVLPHANLWSKMLFAFASAIFGTFIFVAFMQRIKYKDSVLVPLVGIMFGNIIGGITSFLAYRYDLTQALASWTTADFSLILKGRYEMVFLTLPLIALAIFFARHFTIVGMGENFSKNLGISYKAYLILGLGLASALTASIVVTAGSIPYLGLIVPNIISLFKGDNMKKNIIDTALLGAAFVLLCDILGRIIIFPYEISVNLIIGVIGSILFVGIIFKKLGAMAQGGRRA